MKIISNKKMFVIILIIFVMCIFPVAIYLNSNSEKKYNEQENQKNKSDFSYNPDGTVTLGSGMVANGFYNKSTNKIIDSGSLFRPVNGRLEGQISFKQNIPEKKTICLLL